MSEGPGDLKASDFAPFVAGRGAAQKVPSRRKFKCSVPVDDGFELANKCTVQVLSHGPLHDYQHMSLPGFKIN